MRDARKKESRTLTFVAVAFSAATLKFVVGGVTLGDLGTLPAMGGGEYAAAVGTVLAIWLGREWTEKTQGGKDADVDQ